MARLGEIYEHEILGEVLLPKPLTDSPLVYWNNGLVALLDQTLVALGKLETFYQSSEVGKQARWMLLRFESITSCALETKPVTFEQLLHFENVGEKTINKPSLVLASNYFHELRGSEKPTFIDLTALKESHSSLYRRLAVGPPSGEFRRSSTMGKSYLPTAPPPLEMQECLHELEHYLNDQEESQIIRICLFFAELLAIRPFNKGNALVGRLMVNKLLVRFGYISMPMLPISEFIRHNHEQYLKTLSECFSEKDELEQWIHFFLFCLKSSAEHCLSALQKTETMAAKHKQLIMDNDSATWLLAFMRSRPLIAIQAAAEFFDSSFLTAQKTLESLEKLGLVREITGHKRNRLYEYSEYMDFWRGFSTLHDYDPYAFQETKVVYESWTESVVASLAEFRKLCVEHGFIEKSWGLSEDYPALYGYFTFNEWALRITAGAVKEGTKHVEIQMTIDYGHENKPVKEEWTYALYVRNNAVLWEPTWAEDSAEPISKIAKNCIRIVLEESSKDKNAVTISSPRNSELAAKGEIHELFLAIRNVLGKKTAGEAFWQDTQNGTEFVFYCSDVRYVLDFSLSDLFGFLTDEDTKSKIRERLAETIRTLPSSKRNSEMTEERANYEAVFDRGTQTYSRILQFDEFKRLVNGMAKPGETYVISKLKFPPGTGDPIREFVMQQTKK